jgi:hypothetical protein
MHRMPSVAIYGCERNLEEGGLYLFQEYSRGVEGRGGKEEFITGY